MSAPRSTRVAARATLALRFLEAEGPATLSQVAAAIGAVIHHTRYAMVTLSLDGLAHISSFMRQLRPGDKIPRHVAVFSAGPGENAKLSRSWATSACALDFVSTAHLQPIYVDWAATRCPVELEDWQQ